MAKDFEVLAILAGSSVDADGEWTVKLKIPEQYGAQAAALSMLTQRVLKVTFAPEKKP